MNPALYLPALLVLVALALTIAWVRAPRRPSHRAVREYRRRQQPRGLIARELWGRVRASWRWS